MPALPPHANLDQLRHQAKDLLHAARHGDPNSQAALRTLSTRPTLATAQLAVARGHGFASWTRLKVEIERREILNRADPDQLASFLADHPALATEQMAHRLVGSGPPACAQSGLVSLVADRWCGGRVALPGCEVGARAKRLVRMRSRFSVGTVSPAVAPVG